MGIWIISQDKMSFVYCTKFRLVQVATFQFHIIGNGSELLGEYFKKETAMAVLQKLEEIISYDSRKLYEMPERGTLNEASNTDSTL